MSPHEMQCALIALTTVMILGYFSQRDAYIQDEEVEFFPKSKRQYIRRF